MNTNISTFSFSNYRYNLFSNILKDAKRKYRHIYTHTCMVYEIYIKSYHIS